MEIVDTGGIIPDDKALIPTEILRQARVAIENAALLVLVVDSTGGTDAAGPGIGASVADDGTAVCGGGE